MSRNMNDWERECKNLGLQNDYIVLENPRDMHSSKRIHLVSYEKWASEKMTFRSRVHEKCPTCKSRVWWNAQRQVCKICKKADPIMEEGTLARYSKDYLPEHCPTCYEKWKMGAHHCSCGFTIVESKKKSLSHYYHRGYDAAAIDEGHLIKNGNSKRSKSVRKIKAPYKVALSGTPAENGASDLYWLIGWLYGFDSVFEDPLTRYPYQSHGKVGEDHFRVVYGGGGHVTVLDTNRIQSKVSRQEELWEMLDTILIRRKKQDAAVKNSINVPEPIHHRHHLAMSQDEKALYESKLQQFQDWYQLELLKKEEAEKRGDKYRIQTIKICSWMDVLRKVASCPWSFDEFTSTELPAKVSYLKNKTDQYMNKDQKVLIFTAHKKTAVVLAEFLSSKYPDKEAVCIHGGVKKEERFQYMERFQDPTDPLSIIVFTVRTGAESYTLTEAKGVFIFDMDFNGKKLQQCFSRAVRLGQTDVVDVYWLITLDTIEVNIHGVILSKDSGVDIAVDKEEIDFEKIAKQFEGEGAAGHPTTFDYEAFATDMLTRGTSREDIGIA